jgi:hypothetical protein
LLIKANVQFTYIRLARFLALRAACRRGTADFSILARDGVGLGRFLLAEGDPVIMMDVQWI